MSMLSTLMASFAGVSPTEIRAEAWALGSRHRGEVLRGARVELKAPDIDPRRATLLRAVIRSLAPAV